MIKCYSGVNQHSLCLHFLRLQEWLRLHSSFEIIHPHSWHRRTVLTSICFSQFLSVLVGSVPSVVLMCPNFWLHFLFKVFTLFHLKFCTCFIVQGGLLWHYLGSNPYSCLRSNHDAFVLSKFYKCAVFSRLPGLFLVIHYCCSVFNSKFSIKADLRIFP